MRGRDAGLLFLVVGAVGACKTPHPKPNLALKPEAPAQRQMETRRFDTSDELKLLRASLTVLQDEGFQLNEMESALGVITATRPGPPGYSISLVSRRVKRDGSTVVVRVTFHAGYARGRVRQSSVYQVFFTRLSEAVALDAGAL
jgi:hypothetical protein